MLKFLQKQKNAQTSEFTVTLHKAEEKGFGFEVQKSFSKQNMIVSQIFKGKIKFADIFYFNYTASLKQERTLLCLKTSRPYAYLKRFFIYTL